MHGGNIPFGTASAREINRQKATAPDRIVARRKFGDVCKVLWPANTAAEIASEVRVNPRTVERWMSGEIDPSPRMAALILDQIFPKPG